MKSYRYVCPRNGELVPCTTPNENGHEGTHPHVREELAGRRAKPRCETHNVRLAALKETA